MIVVIEKKRKKEKRKTEDKHQMIAIRPDLCLSLPSQLLDATANK